MLPAKSVPQTIFETDDIRHYLLVQRATSIVQQTLTSDSVLFSLPANLFKQCSDTYWAIESHFGDVDGFRNSSRYDTRNKSQLLIVAKFSDPATTRRAVSEGFVHNEMIFKGLPSLAQADRNLIRLQLTLLHIPEKSRFLVDLLDSLRNYGKVCQVKQFLNDGFFEGNLSIMLDVSEPRINDDGTTVPIQPLQRNLYLEAWDTFAQASYRGADPVRYYCRKAGHLRAKCPLLQEQVCYGCGHKGHTRRFCKHKEGNEGQSLDQYIRDTQQTTASINKSLRSSSSQESIIMTNTTDKHQDQQDMMEVTDENETMSDQETRLILKPTEAKFDEPDGTLASKHASIERGV
ncbi:unnamed protein product [Rhizopus stolonifer]